MKVTRYLAVILLASIISGVTAFAQPGPPMPQPGQEHMWQPSVPPEIPGLSDQQKEQIKKLHDVLGEQSLGLRNQLGEKEAHLRTLTTAKSVNTSEVEKAIEEIGQLHTQLRKAQVLTALKIRQLLTDEQRVFFDTHQRPEGPPPPMK